MSSIFTKIIKGEIPCHKIAESNRFFAFLDINPIVKGHTLVVPKEETDYLFDLNDELLGGLIVFSKQVAKAIEATIPCERIAVSVLGLEVPHAHVHLMPMQTMADVSFQNPKLDLSHEELAEIAIQIRKNF